MLFVFQNKDSNSLPQGASVPALGLSNKAVFDDEKLASSDEKKVTLAEELYKEVYFNRIELNSNRILISFIIYNLIQNINIF